MASQIYKVAFSFDGKHHELLIPVSQASKDTFTDIIDGGGDQDKLLELLNRPLRLLPFFREGGVVLDLGSNLGIFSLPLACIGYEVHAFDGSAKNIMNLSEAASLNKFKRYYTHNFAVSDREGYINFHEDGNTGFVPWNSVIHKEIDTSSYYVKSISLDNFHWIENPRKISLIKMDIEGSEVLALKGMKQFLHNAEYPPVYIEINGYCLAKNGFFPNDIFEYFDGLGYRLYLHDPSGYFVEFTRDWIMPLHLYDFLMTRTPLPSDVVKNVESMKESFADIFFDLALNPFVPQRLYAAFMLKNSPLLAGHPRRQKVLGQLADDPDADVRACAR